MKFSTWVENITPISKEELFLDMKRAIEDINHDAIMGRIHVSGTSQGLERCRKLGRILKNFEA
jgi:hypothetical protein